MTNFPYKSCCLIYFSRIPVHASISYHFIICIDIFHKSSYDLVDTVQNSKTVNGPLFCGKFNKQKKNTFFYIASIVRCDGW